MPLSATNMVANGHLIHQDILQFVNLLTGVMTDQPVQIGNTIQSTSDVIVGGAVKFGTSGGSTTTIYSPQAGQINVTANEYVGGGLYFTNDNAYDIGTTGANRPRNVYVASSLNAPSFVASASMTSPLYNVSNGNERMRYVTGSQPSLNIESTDQNAGLFAASASGVGVNTYNDGTTWQRWSTANPSVLFWGATSGWNWYYSAAGSGAISVWTSLMNLSNTGLLTCTNLITTQGVQTNTSLSANMGITMNAGTGTAHNVTIFPMSGYLYFWFANAGGQFILQGSGGVGWNGISCGSISANGSVTATAGLQGTNVTATSNNYYFTNTSVYWAWDGTYLRASHQIVMIGNNFYMANNGGIGLQWDGSYLRMLSPYSLAFAANAYFAGSIGMQGAGPSYAVTVPNSANTYGQGYANAWINASARRFKSNITPLRDPIGIVLDERLHAVEYDHSWEMPEGSKHAGESGVAHSVGLIADDWQEVVPEIVSCIDDEVMGMDYARVAAIVFEALKIYIERTDSRLAILEAVAKHQLNGAAHEFFAPVADE